MVVLVCYWLVGLVVNFVGWFSCLVVWISGFLLGLLF